MVRMLLCAVLALFLVTDVGLAAKGKPKKVKPVSGTVTKFDAKTGDLTIAVKKTGTTQDFKLTDAASFVVYDGDTSKDLKGKEGFKELKTGDKVKITSDADGKVTKVEIGGAKKKKKPT